MSGIFDQIINYSPPLIVSGTVNYKGTWNASTNNPTLSASPASSTKGDYYVVSTAGTQFGITFAIGDWIISNGTAWEKVDLTDAVSSVFGRTGAVVGVSTDYSAVGITNTAIGATNPSTGAFTTLSASTPIGISSGGTNASSAGQALAKLNPITTTVTSGTPIALTNASTPVQIFTGSTSQTVLMPVTSTLEVGWTFTIINNSTQNISVQTSAGTALLTVLVNANAVFRCIATGSTAVTDWEAGLTEFSLVTGTGAVVLQNSPTLLGALNLTGGATANASLATALTTGTLTIGSTTQTGLTIIGQSTQSSTLQIGAGVTASGNTNTIQIGTLGASGSTTAITLGSAANTSSVAVNGTLSATGQVTFRDAGNTYSLNVSGVGGTQIIAFGNAAGVPRIQAFTAGFAAATGLNIQPSGGDTNIGGLLTVGAGLAITGTLSTLATNGVNVFESAGISSVGLQFKTNSTNRFKIETPSASADLAFYAGGTTETLRLTSGGNVGIGTSSPAKTLDVNGSVQFRDAAGAGQAFWVPNKGVGSANSGGFGLGYNAVNYTPASASSNIYWDPNVGYFTLSTSSRKYKRNIVAVTDEQLDKALLLKPSYYQRNEYEYYEYGFIAEEVNEVGLDEFVTRVEGEISGLNYEKMVTLAIGLAQRQAKENANLVAQVAALSQRVAALESN